MDQPCPDYNHDILDPISDYVRLLLKIGIVFGLVLDIACYKYRNLANIILYKESVWQLLLLLVPVRSQLEMTPIMIAVIHFVLFLVVYTEQGI